LCHSRIANTIAHIQNRRDIAMRVDRILAGTLLSVLTLCAAFGAQPPPMDDAARAAQAERMRQQNAAPDTPGTGRFPALKEQVASHPDHVVYRPANLAGLGSTKLGLYIFGNGGCSDDAASARMHLLEIASHGYLAIAPGNVLS
jgi:hypothetical protein